MMKRIGIYGLVSGSYEWEYDFVQGLWKALQLANPELRFHWPL